MTAPEERPGPAPGSGREGDGAEEFVRDAFTPIAGRVESDDGRDDEPAAAPVAPAAPGWRLSFNWILSNALCRR